MTTTIGAGIGGQLGYADASAQSYGTFVAPTNFFEVMKVTGGKTKKPVLSSGLAAGRLVDLAGRRVITSNAAAFSMDLEWMQSGHYGQILKQLFGTTTAPVQQSSTTAYLQTHTPLTLAGIQGTCQLGIPDATGLVHQYNMDGCKILDVQFSCGVDQILTATINWDAQKAEETSALAAPSYPVLNPFHFAQSSVKWGTFGSEVSIDGVQKIDLKVERKQNTSRYYQGNAGLKDEPITNDTVKLTGTITSDYLNKTYFADTFASDTPQSLIWAFTGPIIASTFNYAITFNLPAVFINSPPPDLASKDVINTAFAFEALNDGTHPAITVTLMSTDTTL